MLFRFDCDPKYFNNQVLYDTAVSIDFSELSRPPIFRKISPNGAFTMEIANDQIREMQGLINDNIVSRGMDDQNTVNQIGKMLYWLYDEILYQKPK